MQTPTRLSATDRRATEARISQLLVEQAEETRASARRELGVTIEMLRARLARMAA